MPPAQDGPRDGGVQRGGAGVRRAVGGPRGCLGTAGDRQGMAHRGQPPNSGWGRLGFRGLAGLKVRGALTGVCKG